MEKERELINQAIPWLEGIMSGEETERAGDPFETLEILIDDMKKLLSTFPPSTESKECGCKRVKVSHNGSLVIVKCLDCGKSMAGGDF